MLKFLCPHFLQDTFPRTVVCKHVAGGRVGSEVLLVLFYPVVQHIEYYSNSI